MALHIHFVDCLVCRCELGVERDRLDLDVADENGGRVSCYWVYALPPARMRDKIAPDVCDGCWAAHRLDLLDNVRARNEFRKRGGVWAPSFHQMYLWAWVAKKLEEEANKLGKETQRLVPHLAEKADRGGGKVRKGPLRIYGPRKVFYRRGFAVA